MQLRLAIAGILVASLGAPLESFAADPKLNEAARTRTIDGLVRLLDENYVFPNVAREMGQSLRERAAKRKYDGLDGQALADALTRDLRDVSHDRHLRVEFSAEVLPPEPKGDPLIPPPEAMQAMRRDLARDNFGFKKVEILDGNIGYIRLDLFTPPEFASDIYTASMTFVAQTDALIIDLRYNGGSIHPEAVPLLCSYLFAEPTRLSDLYWRPGDRTEKYWTKAQVAGKKYLNRPIYLLTSQRTFSGAEQFAYDLKNLKRAKLVGDATGGGAHGGGTRRIDDHFSAWIPSGRAISPITGTDWEGTGVAPDVAVPAAKALVAARLDALRQLASSATDSARKEALTAAIASAERDAARFKTIAFALKGYPKAREVSVAGSFNGWSDRSNPLTRRGDAWVGAAEVEPGRLTYKFIADGEWILDPANRDTERDGPHTNSVRSVD